MVLLFRTSADGTATCRGESKLKILGRTAEGAPKSARDKAEAGLPALGRGPKLESLPYQARRTGSLPNRLLNNDSKLGASESNKSRLPTPKCGGSSITLSIYTSHFLHSLPLQIANNSPTYPFGNALSRSLHLCSTPTQRLQCRSLSLSRSVSQSLWPRIQKTSAPKYTRHESPTEAAEHRHCGH
jgi:hypothetical protein